MKKQVIFSIYVLILFILVNLSYLWEENSGAFAFYWGAFLLVSFLLFGFIQLLIVGYVLVKKRFGWKRIALNLFTITLLAILFYFPQGILKPKEQREVYMKAFSEGAANCTSSLTLFKNNEFKELNICFEIKSAEGTYNIKNDTIYFSTTILPRGSDRYYDYAIIRKFEKRSDIVRFYKNDTLEYKLAIIDQK